MGGRAGGGARGGGGAVTVGSLKAGDRLAMEGTGRTMQVVSPTPQPNGKIFLNMKWEQGGRHFYVEHSKGHKLPVTKL